MLHLLGLKAYSMHLLGICSCGAGVEVPLQVEVSGACTPVTLAGCGRQQTNVAACVVYARVGHLQLEKIHHNCWKV